VVAGDPGAHAAESTREHGRTADGEDGETKLNSSKALLGADVRYRTGKYMHGVGSMAKRLFREPQVLFVHGQLIHETKLTHTTNRDTVHSIFFPATIVHAAFRGS
jgi:hypothetical protein